MQMWSGCCGAKVIHQDVCSKCSKMCECFSDDFEENNNQQTNSDDGYDALKDNWVLGDEPLTSSQRRENDSWNETCRREGW